MSQRPSLTEAIDACRPGDDISAHELAALGEMLPGDQQIAAKLASIQAFDKRLAGAIDDVPVPEGLAERLIARLEQTEPVQPASTSNLRQEETTRRGWWAAAAALAAAILVAIVVNWRTSDELTVTPQNWQGLADAWYQQVLDAETGDSWQSSPGPAGFPPSDRVVVAPQNWQHLGEVNGVVYDLAPNARFRATLFVVRADVTGLPTTPPRSPVWTQGRSMAAWQAPGLLYVLVVEGPEDRYRRMIDSGATPVI